MCTKIDGKQMDMHEDLINSCLDSFLVAAQDFRIQEMDNNIDLMTDDCFIMANKLRTKWNNQSYKKNNDNRVNGLGKKISNGCFHRIEEKISTLWR